MNGLYGTTDSETSWWLRPAGGKEVLRVALPMVVSSLSWTVMTFVDRMFLNWKSEEAMSAAFTASNLWFWVFCFPLGVCTYTNTFVSQYFGDRQQLKIGPATWQGIWFALLSSPLILAAIPLAPTIFHTAGHSPNLVDLEIRYFQILCLGGPAMLIAQSASAFYAGQGRTIVMMWVDTIFATLNLILDYFWIFGIAGFPEWGIDGAAWATVVSLWLKAFVYLALLLQREHRINFATFTGMRFNRDIFGRLIYFGVPGGLQMLIDVSGFMAFIILVPRLGDLEAAANSMAFSISSLAFMPVWGLGLATGVLVGQHLGEDRDDYAARATWTTLSMALIYMLFISSLYALAPDLFLFGFFTGSEQEIESHSQVRDLAAKLLLFVAAYNVFDAIAIVFVNAIKGAGDTMFVLGVSVVMACILATACWVGIRFTDMGILGYWSIIAGWIALFGTIFFLRFMQGKWRSMRVIEQVPG